MLSNKLRSFINSKHCTLLGVGVMSKNCVDSTIELANDYNIPLMMIASRRQIEAEKFGGGYVNDWSTETFAKYVKEKDINNNIILARDHGGLWQNNFEKEYTYEEAIKSAKESFNVDIKSGFDMIHIDTSLDPIGITQEKSLQRLCELYKYCDKIAPKNVMFEIGNEEQSGDIQNLDNLEYTIQYVNNFCEIYSCRFPTFIVAQTGTKVVETKNLGNFDYNHKKIKDIVEICNKYNILLKQHNTDYLYNTSLVNHPRLGIHAANVAPEFGVQETVALLDILRKHKLDDIANDFLGISYMSNRWKKWMISNTLTNKEEKAIISGHYVFSDPRFKRLKEITKCELSEKYDINLDNELKIHIKISILRYLINFNMI
jgi:tagatose-1,6-bisphosphate aldolase non-catalytic subunit AgaZ/GatZ